jgi:orotate phosphoribosyltransferase
MELDRVGAVYLDRHFVYKSGKHGSGYVNMDPLFPNTPLIKEVATHLVEPFTGTANPLTIAAPAIGAIVLATHCSSAIAWQPDPQNPRARRYDPARLYPCVWADKQGDDFVFERAGFVGHLKGKEVLVVEDLLTTGGSVAKVCRAAEGHGAIIVGVSVVCNRGGVTAKDLGVPRLEALATVNFDAIAAEVCPLCADNVPIVEDIGHSEQYKLEHPDYPGGYVRLNA